MSPAWGTSVYEVQMSVLCNGSPKYNLFDLCKLLSPEQRDIFVVKLLERGSIYIKGANSHDDAFPMFLFALSGPVSTQRRASTVATSYLWLFTFKLSKI